MSGAALGARRGSLRALPLYGKVLVVSGALGVALTGLHVLTEAGLNAPVFEIEGDRNLVTWLTALGFSLAAIAYASAALGDRSLTPRWWLLAALAAALAVDELTLTHELLKDGAGSGWLERSIEPLLALATIALILGFTRGLGAPVRLLLALSALSVTLEEVIDSANEALDLPRAISWLLVLGEELTQLAAAALLLAAACAASPRLAGCP